MSETWEKQLCYVSLVEDESLEPVDKINKGNMEEGIN